jgi:hypothetical protein
LYLDGEEEAVRSIDEWGDDGAGDEADEDQGGAGEAGFVGGVAVGEHYLFLL